MKRLTVSLPDALDGEIRKAVAAGAARNVSRFLADAARRHLDALDEERLRRGAAVLDPIEEIGLARPPGRGGGPWARLT